MEIIDYISYELYKEFPGIYGDLLEDGSTTRKIYGKLIFDIPEIKMKIYEAKSAIYIVGAKRCSCNPVIGVNYRYKQSEFINNWKELLNEYIEKFRIRLKFLKETERFERELRNTYKSKITKFWFNEMIDDRIQLIIFYKSPKLMIVTMVFSNDTSYDDAMKIAKHDLDCIDKGDYNSVSANTRLTI